MKNHALILMTALVPTTGHKDLIEFAAHLPNTHVWVIIAERTHEPTTAQQRTQALKTTLNQHNNITYRTLHDNSAPQNPEDHPNFWEWWKNTIRNTIPELPPTGTLIVASEPYGQNIADTLQGTFIPYDIPRTLNPTRGTTVRENLLTQWDNIIPPFRQHIGLTITIAGQESVGKTTISKALAEEHPNLYTYISEYARPYLETVGADLTQQKMLTIEKGQEALQRQTKHNHPTPIIIQDTDLYATLGYYNIHNQHTSTNTLTKTAKQLQSDHYFILPDDTPFHTDPLRYGGNKRETETKYWTDQAEHYKLPYELVPEGTLESKIAHICDRALELFKQKNLQLSTFSRD